jgi:hypothetical protein
MANFIIVTPILVTGLLTAHPHLELKAPSSVSALETNIILQANGAPPIPWLPWLPPLPTPGQPKPQDQPKPDHNCAIRQCIQNNRITLDGDFEPIPFPISKIVVKLNPAKA